MVHIARRVEDLLIITEIELVTSAFAIAIAALNFITLDFGKAISMLRWQE